MKYWAEFVYTSKQIIAFDHACVQAFKKL